MSRRLLLQRGVESFYQNIWNEHDKSHIPLLLSPDFCFRGSLGQEKTGHTGFGEYVDYVHEALGQYRCDILDLVVEEPKVFAKMQFAGIHQKVFFGYEPTGKMVSWNGAALFTFESMQRDESSNSECKMLIESLWVLGDVHALLQQLEKNKT